jgi:hypothetical protein
MKEKEIVFLLIKAASYSPMKRNLRTHSHTTSSYSSNGAAAHIGPWPPLYTHNLYTFIFRYVYML